MSTATIPYFFGPKGRRDYEDPHGLWLPPGDGGDELVFNRRAAILHFLKPVHTIVYAAFEAVPAFLWHLVHVRNPPLGTIIFWVFMVLPAVGIYLPAYFLWSWQVMRAIEWGPWLRVDRQTGDLFLPYQNLRAKRSQVRWSIDVDERVDNGQKVCRSQLLMLIDDESGRTQTICITGRYGKRSKATVRAMCGEYARFTGTTVEPTEDKCERRTSNVELRTSK